MCGYFKCCSKTERLPVYAAHILKLVYLLNIVTTLNLYMYFTSVFSGYAHSAPVGERCIAISLSVCVSLCVSVCLQAYLWNSWTNLHRTFLCRSIVTVAWTSSNSVAIHYVLPVSWMTSGLAVVDRTAMRGRLDL